METNRKSICNGLNYIAGAVWIALILARIIGLGFYFNLTTAAFYISCVLFAVGAFTKMRPILLASSGVMVLYNVLICFNNIKLFVTEKLPFVWVARQIALFLVMVGAYAIVLIWILQCSKKKSLANIWIIPVAIMVVKYLVAGYFTIPGFLCFAFEVGALALTLLWLAKAYMPSETTTNQDSDNRYETTRSGGMEYEQKTTCGNSQFANAYQEIPIHILLLLITCGIWYVVWIYRFTAFTNGVSDEQDRNQTNQLLLCLFVPCYWLYWIYQTACRLDKMSAQYNVKCESPTLYVVCALLIGIVPPILMQYRMNEIVQKSGGAPHTTASYQQKQAPVPQSVVAQNQGSETISKESEKVTTQNKTALEIAEEINKYKKLCESEIITVEEFEAKKKQILGL